MLKIQIVLLACMIFISNNLMAESRVDNVIVSSVDSQLAEIRKMSVELDNAQFQLKLLNYDLEAAIKKNKGHEIFLETRKFAGFTALATMSYLGVSAFEKTTMAKAMSTAIPAVGVILLSGAVTIGSQVGVMLTADEADNLRAEIKKLNKFANETKTKIQKEIMELCKLKDQRVKCY